MLSIILKIGRRKWRLIEYTATLDIPKIIDFAIPDAKIGPCSLTEINIVEEIIAGKTENIPLIVVPILERKTAIEIKIPAIIPRNAILIDV